MTKKIRIGKDDVFRVILDAPDESKPALITPNFEVYLPNGTWVLHQEHVCWPKLSILNVIRLLAWKIKRSLGRKEA